MRLLIVEDDPDIAEVVRRGLAAGGFDVDVAADGETGLRAAQEHEYAAVLLDIMLPGLNGWEVCRRLRSGRRATPILMLTARDAVEDRVKGLDLGADDYLPKPFELQELLARVRALVRRDRVHRTRVIQVGDVAIDTGARQVTVGGREVHLTTREYTLLEALASHEGRPLTREYILERVWSDDESYSNTVDVYIGQLRRKIDGGRKPSLIQTLHGVGYVLKAGNEEEP
ncbi:MAG: response regulator transcription factor [Armatimonadetes bacterium]|nr:response regulator transcription factor [Armatimonadota bacterium]